MDNKKETKEVKMKTVEDGKSERPQKLSYEQLNEACAQLYQQNQELAKQVRQLSMANMFKRLDYLFMVLRYESVIKDPDFISSCVQEIKDALIVDSSREEAEGN